MISYRTAKTLVKLKKYIFVKCLLENLLLDEEQVECIENSNLEIWPYPDSVKASNSSFKFAISEPLVDPIRILINKYFGAAEAAKRVLPNADSVVPDANGLQILIVDFH